MSYNHENLIVGCGNILYKDDGLGPEVINYIKENNIEFNGDTYIIDGATSAPHYIFTLPQPKWKNLIIIDIAELKKEPGTIEVLDIKDIKESERYMDVHGMSATFPLHNLKNVNIKLVVCQPEDISTEMEIGLSKTLEDKIPEIVAKTKEVLENMTQ